jgi:DNA transformation protein
MIKMKVTKLTNIGSGLEKMLGEINIKTAEEFLAEDPYDLYEKLEKDRPGLHLAVLASFVGAHTNTPWYFVYHQIKKEYRDNNS